MKKVEKMVTKIVKRNNNIYKYTTFVLAMVLIVVLIALISGRLSYNSTTTIFVGASGNWSSYLKNTSTSTSTSTITTGLYCSTQPTFVHIGNTLICGSFTATILNATNTSVSLIATYNGISINKTVTNQKGYIGDTFALNFSGTVVFGRVWGYFPSNQTVYFQMSTAPIVLTTTITLPSTTINTYIR